MRYLFVVAHPDDECDGAGGTIHKLTSKGIPVAVAILAGKAEARRNLSQTIVDDEKKAFEILGITQQYQAEFPNIKKCRFVSCGCPNSQYTSFPDLVFPRNTRAGIGLSSACPPDIGSGGREPTSAG